MVFKKLFKKVRFSNANVYPERSNSQIHFTTGGAETPSECSNEASRPPSAIGFGNVAGGMSQDAEVGPEVLFVDSGSNPNTYFLNATRPPMNQEEFDDRFHYERPRHRHSEVAIRTRKCLRSCYRPCISCPDFLRALINFVPILGWLPTYEWRSNLLSDVIGGFTVGVMHVPQGIAYALLAGVDPVIGLYTSFFPPLFYMLFGTSRHTSIGSFAVVSLMAGMAVEQFSSGTPLRDSNIDPLANETDTLSTDSALPSPVVVSSTLALCVGVIQILMGVLRLEMITTYFSDQLVSGFTTAASCHVFVAQLKDIFGLKGLPHRSGAGYLFKKLYDIGSNLPKLNLVTTAFSSSTILFLLLGKELVNPFVNRRLKMQISLPWELIVVVLGTLIAQVLHLHSRHGLNIVDSIPTGIPAPMLPDVELIPRLIPSALSISVVVIAVHISLAKMFAKKMAYKVDPGQELFALGFASSLSSFFHVYPVSCSLGRSLVNVEAGTKTQLSTVFSSILLGAIILYMGQWLRTLPYCILSAVIIVALKGMAKKFVDLKTLWPLSKIDFSIWLVSFTATVAWDVTEGLAVSIAYALLTTVFRTQWPRWHFLSNLSGTNDFRDAERYQHVTNHPGICVFRFDSPLLFTNVDRFKSNIHKAVATWNRNNHPSHALTAPNLDSLAANGKSSSLPENLTIPDSKPSSKSLELSTGLEKQFIGRNIYYRHFVIDCSGFTFVDCMGVNALKEIFTELRNQRVLVYFAAAKAPVRDLFEKCGFYQYVPKHNFYPTIRDAVAIGRKRRNASTLQLLDEQTERQYDAINEAISTHPMN